MQKGFDSYRQHSLPHAKGQKALALALEAAPAPTVPESCLQILPTVIQYKKLFAGAFCFPPLSLESNGEMESRSIMAQLPLHAMCNIRPPTHPSVCMYVCPHLSAMWKFEYPAVISTIFSTLLPFWTVITAAGGVELRKQQKTQQKVSLGVLGLRMGVG